MAKVFVAAQFFGKYNTGKRPTIYPLFEGIDYSVFSELTLLMTALVYLIAGDTAKTIIKNLEHLVPKRY